MSGDNRPMGATRRAVLGSVVASLGIAGVAGANQGSLDVDADNLVAGNEQLTITLDGVGGREIQEVTVSISGIAFATVEVLERGQPILAVDASNLARNEKIRSQKAVTVEVWVSAGGEGFVGTDESQVILPG